MKDVRHLLHELNWVTLRIGWDKIVIERMPQGVERIVWQYRKTREVRERMVQR